MELMGLLLSTDILQPVNSDKFFKLVSYNENFYNTPKLSFKQRTFSSLFF